MQQAQGLSAGSTCMGRKARQAAVGQDGGGTPRCKMGGTEWKHCFAPAPFNGRPHKQLRRAPARALQASQTPSGSRGPLEDLTMCSFRDGKEEEEEEGEEEVRWGHAPLCSELSAGLPQPGRDTRWCLLPSPGSSEQGSLWPLCQHSQHGSLHPNHAALQEHPTAQPHSRARMLQAPAHSRCRRPC